MLHNHRKQQTKQAFSFSTEFLANLVPGCTEVPYNCRIRPIPSQSLNLEPRANQPTDWSQNWTELIWASPLTLYSSFYITFVLMPPISLACHSVTLWWHHMQPLMLPHHHVMLWWCHALFGGKPLACILVLEQQFLAQSMSTGAPMLTIFAWRLNVTPSTYWTFSTKVPQCAAISTLPGYNLLLKSV